MRAARRAILSILLLLPLVACSDHPAYPSAPEANPAHAGPVHLVVVPEEHAFVGGQRERFMAYLLDTETGSLTKATDAVWTTSNPRVAIVNRRGLVTARRAGSALITATQGLLSDDAEITVLPSDFSLEFSKADGAWTGDSGDLDLGSEFTIELWIKPSPDGRSRQDLVSKWGFDLDASYVLWIQKGRVRFSTRVSPDNTYATSAGWLEAGVWQHVAVTFFHGTVRLYIDGVLDSKHTGMFQPQVTTNRLSLGRQWSELDFKGGRYVGRMDEVRIWGVARTRDEIRAAMNSAPEGHEAGLVAYWPMNEGFGDVAFDASGNGHHMRLGDVAGKDGADPAWVIR